MLTTLLLCVAPVVQDAPVTQAAINAAIDRGQTYLIEMADPTAARGRKPKKSRLETERSGMRALVLYTILKCAKPGSAEHEGAVHRLMESLAFESIETTYDASCLLLALGAQDPIANRSWMEELTRKLVDWQEKDGHWSYPGLIIDLSNTQYAALGLWAAARSDVPIEASVWERLARATLLFQNKESGGFSYGVGGADPTGSMTAAGLGTLALCEMHLRRADALPADLDGRLDEKRDAGLEWMARNFAVETNPRSGGWLYYYLYGLERIGALAGAPRIGEHDWYLEGAKFLLEEQDKGGSWTGGGDLSETCFALLFLKRATSSSSGPSTPGRDQPRNQGEGDEPMLLGSTGEGPVRIWIDKWRKNATSSLEWPGERGKGPRVKRIEFFSDGEMIGVVIRDGKVAASGKGLSLSWVPASLGACEVTAKAFVLPPDGGEMQLLESAPLEVDVVRGLPSWLDEEPRDLGENLLAKSKPSAKSSSRAKKGELHDKLEYEADFAIDGLVSTPWISSSKDEKPTLSLSLRKAQWVDVVRIRPASLPGGVEGVLSRPTSIEVKVNGKEVYPVTLDKPGRPATVELEEAVKVRRIEIVVLEKAEGEVPGVGIAEVELYLREE